MSEDGFDAPGVDSPPPGTLDYVAFAEIPWIGHRDPLTALHHAFAAGISDGNALNYGAQRPSVTVGAVELFYLRGYAIGVGDWHGINPEVPDPLHDFAARNPRRPRDYHLPPPGVAAILPLPFRVEARPVLHATVEYAAFHALSLPHVPLPTGVDRHGLTAHWPVEQKQRLYATLLRGCWIVPEGRFSAPVLTSFLVEVLRLLFSFLWPRDDPPLIEEPPSTDPLAQVGAVFLSGTDEHIQQLVRGRFWTTTLMCLIVFPNSTIITTFVCTFESTHFSRSDADAVHDSIRSALDGSVTAANFCLDRGREPVDVFSSLRLEYVRVPISGGRSRHLWNVDMDLGFGDPAGLRAWRWIISALLPSDDDGRWMRGVHLSCDVCGCIRHPSELCPTRAYPEWQGAVRVAPN